MITAEELQQVRASVKKLNPGLTNQSAKESLERIAKRKAEKITLDEPPSMRIYRSDYRSSMSSEILFQIREELMEKAEMAEPDDYDKNRLHSINKVLRDRGFKNIHL